MRPRQPALLIALLAASCGSEFEPPTEPAEAVRDIAQSEDSAAAFERVVRTSLVDRIAGVPSLETLFSDRFRGRLFEGDAPTPTGLVAGEVQRAELTRGESALDSDEFVQRLGDVAGGWAHYDRLGAQADRFALDVNDPTRAFARTELRWAGRPDASSEARRDVRLTVEWSATRVGDAWQASGAALVAGTVLDSGGPRFRHVGAETGFTWARSSRNRSLEQTFIDQHRTFALGGLSILDWEGDGFPDIVAVREGQFSLLFRNDGRGGFVPEPLPPSGPAEHPAFLLAVDLDGDGREELVGSKPTGFEGDRAYIGLWTRTGSDGWTHRPRAIALPNPVGLRRLAVQTVVPFDLEGDGDLDLFFAVYGDANSRGEDYNTVHAKDGADNHLAVNQGDLTFTEESEARGLGGERYTYVATAFDFDDDGDLDLFEGNDFGPNFLWLNDGAGRFTEDRSLGFGDVPAYTMGATLADFDNSGKWSLYISNMSSEEGCRIVPLAPDLSNSMRDTVATIARGNMLYTQTSPGAPWTERAVELGVNEGEWAWGCSFVDIDNDGDKDLTVTNGFTSHSDPDLPDWQTYYWRQVVADGASLERGEPSRDVNGGGARGSFNGYEHDRLFLNEGGGTLPDAGYVLGADDDHDGRAVAPIDFDGDGDMDLALWTLTGLALLENVAPTGTWTRVALEDARGSRTPLGAVVEIRAGGVVRRDMQKLVDGFQTQVHPHLHFGLGAAESVDVTVRWPSGAVDEWSAQPAGQLLVLVEGEGGASDVGHDVPTWTQGPLRVTLDPRSPLQRADGGVASIVSDTASDRPTLVRIAGRDVPHWPSELFLDDVRHVAIAARGGASDARAADLELLAPEGWRGAVFGEAPPPVAWLVLDGEGRLVRAFRGDPAAADLARFVELARDESAFPGLLIEHGRQALREDRYREALRFFDEALANGYQSEEDAPAHEGRGRAQVHLGRLDLAEAAYESSVAADPDYGIGHFNLGVTRSHLGRPEEAIPALEEALRIEGPLPRTLLALGEAAALADRLELARDAFERGAELLPGEAGVRINLAKVLARLDRLPEAKATLDEVLGFSPGHAEARAVLGRVVELMARNDGE